MAREGNEEGEGEEEGKEVKKGKGVGGGGDGSGERDGRHREKIELDNRRKKTPKIIIITFDKISYFLLFSYLIIQSPKLFLEKEI